MVDPANTVLDGDALGTVLVLSAPDQLAVFLVDGITLQNGSASSHGGGLYVKSNGDTTLTNNTISENIAGDDGGGVSADNSTITLTNNTISENIAGDGGGGVSAYYSTVTLVNNTITGNSASYFGGGVFAAYGTGIVTLVNNTITGNSERYGHPNFGGGGVYAYSSTVILVDNTITGNTAEGVGGGICLRLYDESDIAYIYNNIIWNNTADQQGHDLFIDNDRNDDYLPSTVELYNNDFDQSAAGTYIQLPFAIDPSNLDNLDPLFVDAANEDYHLTAPSPCINTGDNDAPEIPDFDKDGNDRILDGTVDMGAYEYTGTIPPSARFTANVLSGVAPLTVEFSDQSIGNITSWSWDFGDGGVSTDQNPTHTYQDQGAYSVSLTVTGPLGSDTETKTDYINVSVAPPDPDIKANGSEFFVPVTPGEEVNITVQLDPQSYSGQPFDWWIGLFTYWGNYWFTPRGWVPSNTPVSVFQIGLVDLPEVPIFISPLPVGFYTFFFILDANPDGIFNDMSFYDYVNVICGQEMMLTDSNSDMENMFLEKMQELME